MSETFPISLRLGRVTSNKEDDFISLEITDELSGVQFVDAKLSLKQFADLLTSQIVCTEADLRTEFVGYVAENKEEEVHTPGYSVNDSDKAALLSSHEVDGWKARSDDLGNGHRRTKKGYNVIFYRHVKPDAKRLASELEKIRSRCW